MADPSDLIRYVFGEHVKNYGDPDLQFQFDTNGSNLLSRLDVFVWQPTNKIPMTTFSTMGMADTPMKGVTYRCEIHWIIRGTLSDTEQSECASFLANLAEYPFKKNTFLDHWHIIPNLPIPEFNNCSNILFHPTFITGGWDNMEWNTCLIKILNLVPITNEENKLAVRSGVNVMLDYLYKSQIDIFSDRK